MQKNIIQSRALIAILIAVTIAFFVLLRPFYNAIFWAVTLAVLFWPIHQRINQKFAGKNNLAAITSLLVCVLIVIIPLTLVSLSLIREVLSFYSRMTSDGNTFSQYLQQILAAIPDWAWEWMGRLGVGNLAEIQQKLAETATQALSFVYTRAVNFGQDTMAFGLSLAITLYLLFFFFRDGAYIVANIRRVVPMDKDQLGNLGSKFTSVVKATVKGNITVAAVQGMMGGLMFMFMGIQGPMLWGVVMAFLSLLPAVGATLVWGPVAIYLLATGSILKGALMIAIGFGVIGLVDNLLRPILVGKETKMPDYLVLLSTLGGLSLFGLTGFVAGPVIAALFIAIWAMFNTRQNEVEAAAQASSSAAAGMKLPSSQAQAPNN